MKKREGYQHLGSRKRFCHCSRACEFLLHEVGQVPIREIGKVAASTHVTGKALAFNQALS